MAQSTHRVLVVDDYRDAVDATCMLLGRLGHDCAGANSGARALKLVEEFHPDLVLLDIGLPDMSGYEVARELRQRHGRAVYMAAVTGWGQPEDRLRSLAAGFDQHIIKPATVQVLRELISEAERARSR